MEQRDCRSEVARKSKQSKISDFDLMTCEGKAAESPESLESPES